MRFKAITVILGAVAALSFSTPTKFAGPADAADAVPPPPPQAIKVPEFVPIVNFSEFVMAVQTFASQNPPDARIAAEVLSAKFAANGDAQKMDVHTQVPLQQAAAEPAKSIIVTRPVVVADVPPVPDPDEQMPKVADPAKVITIHPAEHADTAPRKHKAEKKAASTSTSRSNLDKKFQPAMGLGMVIDSAEDAPPMSTLTQKKRKVKADSQANAW